MSEVLTENAAARKPAQSGSVPLSDIFFLTLRHWPWILLSVALCVGAAYLWLLRTPDVYTRAAEIQIKDESSGQSAVGADEFSNLGLFQSNTNIQNEMLALKAKDLMEEVVRRLSLDMNYFRKGTFHDVALYGSTLPVSADVPSLADDASASFDIHVSPAGKVTISDIVRDGTVYDKSCSGSLAAPVQTPLGSITVIPSAFYRKGEQVDISVRKMPLDAARASYNARLAVAMTNDKSSVIRITMADESTERADAVLNAVIGVYNENWIHDKNQIAVSTSNFINDRLGVIEGELGNVDSDISSYKSANLVPDVNAAASMYMTQNQQTQAQMLELSNQLQMTRYIRSYLASDSNRDQLLPANTGVQNNNIQSLISEYNQTVLRRNALVAKSSDKNPLVSQLDEDLAAQRRVIIRTVDNDIVNLNTQISALRANEAQLTSRIASNPTQAKNLLSVERQQKVKESLYLFLLQKREENELSQAFTAYNTKVVNKPGSAGVPPTPARASILGVAFLVGLALPFGATFLIESGNTRLRGRKDVEHLATPFLGEIPQYSPDGRKRPLRESLLARLPRAAARFGRKKTAAKVKGIIVRPGKRDIINEAFRVLRTNVEFMCNTAAGPKVVAVTSFNPGSGKSFITINLAASIAIKDKRVLVIDGDMRHGSASSIVGSPAEGLSDFLRSASDDPGTIIVHAPDCPQLDVLPIGSVPPNPTELLEQPKFAAMLDSLRREYDYIFIDCPPVEVVADAQIIDAHADRTFFVLRAGLLERAMIPELDRLYEAGKFRAMAFILNGTRNDQGRYGYAHSYRYGYGYGYGYGYSYGSDAK